MKKVSVILCTHNPREILLNRTINSLKEQSLPFSDWEFVFIDNGSMEVLSKVYELKWHPCARHLREDQVGLTFARLRGIQEANGEILVFVDDDTYLNHDYLENVCLISKQWPFIGAWGGNVLPEFELPPPVWMRDDVWRLTVENVEHDIWSNLRDDFRTIPVGAGMCVRRAVAQKYLERCRCIETLSLDRSGTSLSGYGDLDMALCAVDLGLGTGKSTKLSLTHLIPASRLTIEYFTRHAEGDAASLLLFRAMRGLPLQYDGPPSLVDKLRIQWHYLINRVPKERRILHKAHIKGLDKGYKKAQEYLNKKR